MTKLYVNDEITLFDGMYLCVGEEGVGGGGRHREGDRMYPIWVHVHLVIGSTTLSIYNSRRIEEHTMRCVVTLGDARPSDVITKIRQIILHSDHPEAVHYMRGIAAIRQALAR